MKARSLILLAGIVTLINTTAYARAKATLRDDPPICILHPHFDGEMTSCPSQETIDLDCFANNPNEDCFYEYENAGATCQVLGPPFFPNGAIMWNCFYQPIP